ncbi:AP endonuclease [Siphonobacter sp. BAB-5385]|uniref:sugar phosphate isomerase/epimerase family protein n=1 Tax=unclassified Siphonobacter TaxID=2635712 RepID=UPI000B9ED7FF|nr:MULTISPECIES: sugar phosphate isomerase/epimerase family protein [unclassified Siphonobacter]OZI10133.1 AP endonuclease [Siphonobacter sp. BAB-5385]PMD97513.1 AP endonuclease [Siphonobacter sp. BAB-5405]
MLDLGFVSAILPDYNLENVLKFASQHEFKCVEIMCWPKENSEARRYAGVTHIDVDDLNDQTIATIRNRTKEYGVSISGLGYYPNPLDPDPEKAEFYREHIKKIIRAAAQLRIPVVNTFIGRNPKLTITENLKLFAEHWPAIVKVAEEHNVKIGIENCPMWYTDDEWPGGKNLATTPAIWDRMFEIIPSPILGLNYDPSHLIWQMMDEIRPIYDYKDRLHHIHLKDVKVYREKLNRVGIMANPSEYHSPKLPGLGDVNWRGFFAALTDVRYRGPVVIEVEDKAYEGSLKDVQTAILTSRNYVRQFLG